MTYPIKAPLSVGKKNGKPHSFFTSSHSSHFTFFEPTNVRQSTKYYQKYTDHMMIKFPLTRELVPERSICLVRSCYELIVYHLQLREAGPSQLMIRL